MAFVKKQLLQLRNKWIYRTKLVGDSAGLNDICKSCKELSTVHDADVKAVVACLPQAMFNIMKNGKSVYIEGLGTFSLKIKSGEKDTAAALKISEDIKKVSVAFKPEMRKNSNGVMTRTILDLGDIEWIDVDEISTNVSSTGGSSTQTPTTDEPTTDQETGGSTDDTQSEDDPYNPFGG